MDLLLSRRRLMMASREEYIVFADPIVEQICVSTWGDGTGLTPSRAARVTSLSSNFSSNTGITSFHELVYFTGLSSIVDSAFTGCSSLTGVTLPNKSLSIGAYAFNSCTSLQAINFEKVTSIGNNAFQSTGYIDDIYAPNITTVGNNAFAGSKVKKISNLGNVVNLGTNTTTAGGCFSACTALQTVVLPSSVKNLNFAAFKGCTAMTDFTCSSTGTSVGREAFIDCTSLTSVTLNITSFTSYRAFQRCTALRTLDFTDSTFTTTYSPNTQSNGTFIGCTSLTGVTLPSTCSQIGSATFSGCTNLSIINPDYITTINPRAFYGTKLTVTSSGIATFPSLTYIDALSFQGSKVVELTFPVMVNFVGSTNNTTGSFYNVTTLTKVDIGATCTNIGQHIFRNCSNLATIICRATTPPSLGANTLYGTPTTQKIYVPYSADHSILAAYQSATSWSSVASRINELDADGNIPT